MDLFVYLFFFVQFTMTWKLDTRRQLLIFTGNLQVTSFVSLLVFVQLNTENNLAEKRAVKLTNPTKNIQEQI